MPRPPIPIPVVASPIIRRVAWHIRRVGGQLDRRFFISLTEGIIIIVAVAAILITVLEKPPTFESLFDSFNWGIATVLGAGDAEFVTSPGGRVVGWLLILFGVAMLGMITGALVAMVIDFLLKEGQGLGSAGHKDHIIVCGWNSTARDLIDELKGDDYPQKVVVLAELDKNPAGSGVYFVRGDATNAEDLERAGIQDASAALVFPIDGSDEADMHSILALMAIESIAPQVRTVAEVNNPKHEPHFLRADVDELLVTSKVASRLLARSALYPGLSGIITDIVSGGEGSELYRITLPDEYIGQSIDTVAMLLRQDHKATLLSVNRGGHAFVNPGTDFVLQAGDDAIVVAEGLGIAGAAQAPRHQHGADDRLGGAERLTAAADVASRPRLERLDRRGQCGQPVLRVGEQHPGLGVGVELVVDAGVAASHRALDDDDRLGVVDVEDRHPRHRRAGPARRRVRHVVGADDEGHVGPIELGVDLVHLLELRIGHVGLGEEDVHVPRHPAGDRVDRVLDVDTLGLEQLGQLADGVLGLRDGEAVARHDDHRLRIGQLDRHVVGADLADGAAGSGGRAGGLVAATEPADHDVHDRPVHGVGHQLGQDRAGRADEGAGDDEDRVAEHEAGHRRRRAGERVEQADDDRHVGAADRQDHRDPEDQAGQHDHEQERQRRLAAEGQDTRRAQDQGHGPEQGDQRRWRS